MASTSKPNAPNLEGAAAAAALWTPTGGRKITVHKHHANTGNYYLEIRYAPRASSKRADLKSITSLHEDYPGKPGFLGCYHHKSWVTEAAARAAIDHFRAWVDGGRRKQTAAATARSNQPAAEDVVLLPERYSERRNFRVRVDAMLRSFSRASGVVVKLMLLTSVHTTTQATGAQACTQENKHTVQHKRVHKVQEQTSNDSRHPMGESHTRCQS